MAGAGDSKDSLERAYYLAALEGNFVPGVVSPTLTSRMFARAPSAGYSIWLDTADATYIYIAEAPSADGDTAATFRGIRVTKDASGNPLGKVQQAEGFTWADRAAFGGWS